MTVRRHPAAFDGAGRAAERALRQQRRDVAGPGKIAQSHSAHDVMHNAEIAGFKPCLDRVSHGETPVPSSPTSCRRGGFQTASGICASTPARLWFWGVRPAWRHRRQNRRRDIANNRTVDSPAIRGRLNSCGCCAGRSDREFPVGQTFACNPLYSAIFSGLIPITIAVCRITLPPQGLRPVSASNKILPPPAPLTGFDECCP